MSLPKTPSAIILLDLRQYASILRAAAATPFQPFREYPMLIFHVLFHLLRLVVSGRATLVAENLALRQQLAVLRRSVNRPRIKRLDRVFWVWLSRLWTGWRSVLVIVKPDTVVKWHRASFRLYWCWKSRAAGRPKKDLVKGGTPAASVNYFS